jgi:hypothetical protein
MRKALPVVVLLILAAAPAAADWVGLDPVGGSLMDEVGPGGCCARGRGYTFVALGDVDNVVHPFEHASESWFEDFEWMPEFISNAGAMAYERLHHSRLFVASDDENHLNVYYFNYTWGLDGHWLDPELQAPIDLPEFIGPGVALAFQPVENPMSMLSGFLYLLAGDGRHLWRRAFNLVPWAPDGLGPGDGDTVALDSLDFDWRADSRWTSYNLQVSTSQGFDKPVIDSVLPCGEFQPPRGRLAENRTYYWRVRGMRRGIVSEWSDARRLTLTRTPGPRHSGQFPTEGLLTSGDEPVFDWPSAARAVSYRLQVAASAEFADPVLDVTVPVSEYTRAVPLRTGTWYWRTRWQAPSSEWSVWSASSSFETDYGWAPLPSIPEWGSRVEDGGAMCHVSRGIPPIEEALYVLVGNNSHEFWRFNLAPGVWAWEPRASTTPFQTSGASITSRSLWSASGSLMATMGGEDLMLWRFNITDNVWVDVEPLPRLCGAGSCIVKDEIDYDLTLAIAGEYLPPPTNFYKRVAGMREDDGPMADRLSGDGPARVHLVRSAGQVSLHYMLGTPGPVQAVVFDAAGRRVRTLFSGQQATGEHSLAWDFAGKDGGRVGAGLYFVALDFDGSRTMMKVPVW